MRLTIIANPRAGGQKGSSLKTVLALLKARGIMPEIRITTQRGDACRFARDEVVKKTDIVMAAGGDGTINEIANGLAGSPVKLAVFPGGTANVFALEANIPLDPVSAVDLLFTGRARPVNLGHISLQDRDREGVIRHYYFLLMAGIGFDGGVLAGIKRSSIARWGRAAYLFEGIKVLPRYTRSPITLTVDQAKTINGYSAVIGNARYYGGKCMVTPRASLFDASLELCVFTSKGPLAMCNNALKIFFHKHGSCHDLYYATAQRVEASSQHEVFVQTDGDCVGKLPARLSVSKSAIFVVLPQP